MQGAMRWPSCVEQASNHHLVLLSFSEPCRSKNSACIAGTSSQSGETGAPPNSSTGSTSTYGPPRLTFPLDATLLASDETEPDSLPFALDRESSLVSPSSAAMQGGGAPSAASETEQTLSGGPYLHHLLEHTHTHTNIRVACLNTLDLGIMPCWLPCL